MRQQVIIACTAELSAGCRQLNGDTLRDFLPKIGKIQSYASGKAQVWIRSVTQPSLGDFFLMERMIGTTVLHLVPAGIFMRLGLIAKQMR
jgi:hypothetical protein